MSRYRYRITVEELAGTNCDARDARRVSFEAASHDDVLAIVDRLRARLPLDEDTVASLGVGLKLFSEVALAQRKDPMFAAIQPALGGFIRELKQRSAEAPPVAVGRLL